eukprot:TRINITY_DN7683_c0_g1_i8.p2 TRINITY_DN7683_c0_g1~~TRINITY_DN7683_c0_g1_i8.p2  ORF type:complete len:210 (+),score=-22.82 TRINITY_DN7683_c0_g1_i8:166-795(+)
MNTFKSFCATNLRLAAKCAVMSLKIIHTIQNFQIFICFFLRKIYQFIMCVYVQMNIVCFQFIKLFSDLELDAKYEVIQSYFRYYLLFLENIQILYSFYIEEQINQCFICSYIYIYIYIHIQAYTIAGVDKFTYTPQNLQIYANCEIFIFYSIVQYNAQQRKEVINYKYFLLFLFVPNDYSSDCNNNINNQKKYINNIIIMSLILLGIQD